VADISSGEHPGHAGLIEQRWTGQRPAGGRLSVGIKNIRAGEDEPSRVLLQFQGQPSGARNGADENKQSRCIELLLRVIGCAAEAQLLESARAGGRCDFRTEADVDVGRALDVSHQVGGHLFA
jgi:hypothetical protein